MEKAPVFDHRQVTAKTRTLVASGMIGPEQVFGEADTPSERSLAVLLGEDFRLSREDVEGSLDVYDTRRVLIEVRLNEATGQLSHLRYQPGFDSRTGRVLSELQDLPGADLYKHNPDAAEATRTLRTQKKHFSSTAHPFDEAKTVRQRGGDPDYRIPKPPSSFLLQEERK